jgi:hypothetical protein
MVAICIAHITVIWHKFVLFLYFLFSDDVYSSDQMLQLVTQLHEFEKKIKIKCYKEHDKYSLV